ncbi:MAG: RpoL/Rpb11 RNA polymerase subunit family protein [Nanoarchaeota archaeon]
MEILEKTVEDKVLALVTSSDEESLFSLLKVYLEKNPDVDIVGLHKGHYLIDKTEFFLKTKKGNPLEVFKKTLDLVKKDLDKLKVK